MLKSFFTAATLTLTTIAFCSPASAGELADLIEANTKIGEQADTLNKRQQRMMAYQQRMVYFAQQRQQYEQQVQRRSMIQQNILQQAQAMAASSMVMQQQIYGSQMAAMAQLSQRQQLRSQALPTAGTFTPIHDNSDPYAQTASQTPICGNDPTYRNSRTTAPSKIHVSGFVQ